MRGQRGTRRRTPRETETDRDKDTDLKQKSERQSGAKQLALGDSQVTGGEGEKVTTHMTLMGNIAVKYEVSAHALVCYVCAQSFFVAHVHCA